MPTVTRSHVKRNCIEFETPLMVVPSNVKVKNRSKKRKLDKEFSGQCLTNEQVQHVYGRSVQKRKKTTTETTEVVWTNCSTPERKKNTKEHCVKIARSKIPVAKKKEKSKNLEPIHSDSPDCSMTAASEVVNEQERNSKRIKKKQSDYNLRRANKRIEDISSDLISKNESCKEHESAADCVQSGENDISGKCSEKVHLDKICIENNTNPEDKVDMDEVEDYQQKYFQLLDTMKALQEKFLVSQQNFEKHMAANDAFVEEMKVALEEKNRELVLVKKDLKNSMAKNDEFERLASAREFQVKTTEMSENEVLIKEIKANLEEKSKELALAQEELQRSKANNSFLENCNKIDNQKIDNQNTNAMMTEVESVKMMHEETRTEPAGEETERRYQCTVDNQSASLELYKLLTGVSLEKQRTNSDSRDGVEVVESYLCTIALGKTKELKFVLSQDHEFAEIEYQPLLCDSPSSSKRYASFPEYLKEKIFFADEQAPKFLIRLLRAVHEPGKNKRSHSHHSPKT